MREVTSARQIGGALLCLAYLVVGASGCTIRYSQTLVGTIEPVQSAPITHSASGFGIGLGSTNALTFSEPRAVNELIDSPCDLALSQSDYRGTWFSLYYVSFVWPKTETVAYCVK